MGKYMKMETVIAVIIATCLMGGCAGTYTKKDTGTALGALTGGALAYGLGKNSSNKEIWTVLGMGLGAMMGSNIGAQLDQRDRLLAGKAFQTTMETLPDGRYGGWNNPNTGNNGVFRPVRTFDNYGAVCREFTQTIIIGNKPQEGFGMACRENDGSWTIQ
jgi:surface antigen|tara:strand:- start:4472 stop:4951 length:480 start_codon:yes stop_codon:yes gene_type:complete